MQGHGEMTALADACLFAHLRGTYEQTGEHILGTGVGARLHMGLQFLLGATRAPSCVRLP